MVHQAWLAVVSPKPDIGADVSLEAAKGVRLDEAALNTTLSGATLSTTTDDGSRLRIDREGHYSVLEVSTGTITAKGSWDIRNDRFCRISDPGNRRRCYAVLLADGDTLRFFDRYGLPRYDMRRSSANP